MADDPLRALWEPEHSPRRGPKPSLSVARITETAIAIADREGVVAASMTRVAEELGVTTMALYRYVANKDTLLSLMADAGVPSPAEVLGDPADDWRDALDEWMTAQVTCLRERPWILDLPLTTTALGPNRLAWIDWAFGRLESTPLQPYEKLSVVGLLAAFVLALAREAVESQRAQGAQPDLAGVLSRYADRADYPHVAAVFEDMEDVEIGAVIGDLDYAWHQQLFGVRTILDGVAAFIERAPRSWSPRDSRRV